MKKTIEINTSNYTEFQDLDVVGFSLAHAGAQGEGGCIKIITSNGMLYHTNICNSIKLEELFTVCLPLKDCCFSVLKTTVPTGWTCFYMGGGNFLVVKKQYKERLSKLTQNELYWKWTNILQKLVRRSSILEHICIYFKNIIKSKGLFHLSAS